MYEPSARKLLETLQDIGAIQSGHFLLSSGKHSANYVQCARLFEHPASAQALCSHLVSKLSDLAIDVVAGPALGGVIIAYELARQLGRRNIFSERQEGQMVLRRGFTLQAKERVLVVEDVVTTGGSARELLELVAAAGATPVAVAAIINRHPQGENPFNLPFFPLLNLDFPAWQPEDCPLCQNGSQAIKPGSRPG